MKFPLSRALLRCPYCNGGDCVKNGSPRGVQRFRCGYCGRNFSPWPKNRASASYKYDQVGRRLNGLELADDASVAAVDRWVSEAQEHHNWFLGRIATYGVNAYWYARSSGGGRNKAMVEMHPGRAAVQGAYQAYLYALLRDPRDFLIAEEFLTICDEMEKHALGNLWTAVREYLLSEPDDSGWRVTEVQGPLGPRLKFQKSWPHKKSLLAL